ncbi:hypothetical protein AMJ80_05635 [bacterium SM23_31]|nr:MAG: hypothetical protein AMJ80_05635 [bacterium SM23_31]
MYDERVPGAVENVKEACTEILHEVVNLGGTISGEHGIGIEKNNYMHLVFSEQDLACMAELKNVFDPDGYLNPGKIFPVSLT